MDTSRRLSGCTSAEISPGTLDPATRVSIATVFKALGDPTRLEVFDLIAAQPEPICVCDIVSRFDVSQPTISHHLRVLREAGLLLVSRRGNWAFYEIDRQGAVLAASFLEEATLRVAPV